MSFTSPDAPIISRIFHVSYERDKEQRKKRDGDEEEEEEKEKENFAMKFNRGKMLLN